MLLNVAFWDFSVPKYLNFGSLEPGILGGVLGAWDFGRGVGSLGFWEGFWELGVWDKLN
jgi:hypothetical protein